MKCRFCGELIDNSIIKCSSCGAPAGTISRLSERDTENLKNYIISIEKSLEGVKKKADGKILAAFFILSVIWISSSIFLYLQTKGDLKITVSYVAASGALLFIVFGGFVGRFENMEIEKYFRKKIKNEISEYLGLMQYTAADFRIAAGMVLDEKSYLAEFISEI